MGSLYHIKAMGYSARIQRQHIDAIKNAIEHSQKIGNYEDDLKSIIQYMNTLQPDYASARELFEEAKKYKREDNPSKPVRGGGYRFEVK